MGLYSAGPDWRATVSRVKPRAGLLSGRFWHSVLRVLLALGVLAMMGGCSEQLHEELSEKEANEMVAILRNQDVQGAKQADGKNLYSVTVPTDQFAKAVQILRSKGYPRVPHANLGDLFKPSGLVPTPMEEVVRYIHGLSQELTATIRQISGVTYVRVHIALSTKAGGSSVLVDTAVRSKASVLVEYNADQVQLGALIPRIKRLVGDSVPLLNAEDVAVLAQEGYRFAFNEARGSGSVRVLGKVLIRQQDFFTVATVMGTLCAIAALLSMLVAGTLHIRRKKGF